MSTEQTGVQLTVKHFVLAFLMVIFPVTIKVDGQPMKGKWGPQFLPLSAGTHSIEISWKYLWLWDASKAMTQVSVTDGQVVSVTYVAPWYAGYLFGLLPGKISLGV